MVEFITDNYLWFIIGGVILVMALIGYIAEKTNFGRGYDGEEREKEPEKIKREKPKREKPERRKKEKLKKEKVKKEKAPIVPIVEDLNDQPKDNVVKGGTDDFKILEPDVSPEELLEQELSNESLSDMIDLNQPINDVVNNINEQPNDIMGMEEDLTVPFVLEDNSSNEDTVEPLIEDIVTEEPILEEVKVETIENNEVELPDIEKVENKDEEDIWKF